MSIFNFFETVTEVEAKSKKKILFVEIIHEYNMGLKGLRLDSNIYYSTAPLIEYRSIGQYMHAIVGPNFSVGAPLYGNNNGELLVNLEYRRIQMRKYFADFKTQYCIINKASDRIVEINYKDKTITIKRE